MSYLRFMLFPWAECKYGKRVSATSASDCFALLIATGFVIRVDT
jgi:hypothetical protein